MPINILALSDIHGKISSISSILRAISQEQIDLITVSGDLTHFGSEADLLQILQALEGAGAPINYVLGNCDPIEFRKGIPGLGRCLEEGRGGTGTISIIGTGGSTPTPFGTPFEVEEEALVGNLVRNRALCAHTDGGATMFLVHNPPAGKVVDKTSFGKHVGSKKLAELVSSTAPLVVQCGHIHEASGKEKIGVSTVFNPGPAMSGKYALVKIDGKEVNVSIRSV